MTSEPELDVLGDQVARWYVLMLEAGMKKCDKDGMPLTPEQRFVLLTAGQLAIGDWRDEPGSAAE